MLSQSYSRLIFFGLIGFVPLATLLGWSSRTVWGGLLLAGVVFTFWFLDAVAGWNNIRSRLPRALILFAAAATVSTLTSTYHYPSLLGLLQIVAGLAIFDLARIHARTPNRQRMLMLCLVVSGTVVAAHALSQAPALHNLDLGVTSVFGWKNALAGFLAFIGPLTLAGLATPYRRWVKIVYSLALALILAAIFFTVSQAGWLALGIGIAAMIVGLTWTGRRLPRSAVGYLGISILLAAILVTVQMPATNPGAPAAPDTLATAARLAKEVPQSANARLQYWQTSLDVAAQFPIFGVGLGNFVTWYQHEFREPWLYTVSPHNYFIYLLVSVGGIAALALAWFLLHTGIRTWSWFRTEISKRATTDSALLGLAWAVAAASLLLHSSLDVSLEVPSIALLWWLVLGVLSTYVENTTIARTHSLTAHTLRLSGTVVCLAATMWLLVADNRYQRAEIARGEPGQLKNAIGLLEQSRRLMPWSANTHEALAFAYWDAVLTRAGDRSTNLALALQSAQHAEQLDPFSAHRQWILGTIYLYVHTPAAPYQPQALYHLQQAIVYDFHDPTYYIALTRAYQRFGLHAKARQTVDAGLALYPPGEIGKIVAGAEIYEQFGLREKLQELQWLRQYSEEKPTP